MPWTPWTAPSATGSSSTWTAARPAPRRSAGCRRRPPGWPSPWPRRRPPASRPPCWRRQRRPGSTRRPSATPARSRPRPPARSERPPARTERPPARTERRRARTERPPARTERPPARSERRRARSRKPSGRRHRHGGARRHRRFRLAIPVAALATAVVIALGVTVGVQQHRLNQVQAQQRELTAVLSARDARIVSGTTALGGHATMVVAASLDKMVFSAAGLPALAHARVYELWLLTPSGQAIPSGLLPSARSGEAASLIAAGPRPATTSPSRSSRPAAPGSPPPSRSWSCPPRPDALPPPRRVVNRPGPATWT